MVEFSQVFTPSDVYRFIRERDRNHDFVLDSEEIPAALISSYDKKEGAFPKKLESFELMQARSIVWPGFFSPEVLAKEQKASHQWLALRDRLSRQQAASFADILPIELGLAADASVDGGKFFAEAVKSLDDLAQIYFAKETKIDFPWQLRSALVVWHEIGKKGGDSDWLFDILVRSCHGNVDPSEVWNLWRRLREEGSAEQSMDFIGQLIDADPKYIRKTNRQFERGVEAFRLGYDIYWKKRYPPVDAARMRSLIFASPFLMTDKTGEAFIEYPLRVMIEQGYSDQEIAGLFKVYLNKSKEPMVPLAEALIGLNDAGVSPFVRYQILKEVGVRFEDESAKSALEAIAHASGGLARLRGHYAVQEEDQEVKDQLFRCFSQNPKDPGPVIALAGSLAYRGWAPSRVATIIGSLPELDGDWYYREVGDLVQRFSDQLVYEGDIAFLFSTLGYRYHGREGSAIFLRKVQEAYLLVEPSPLTRKNSGISDRQRFQNFVDAQKS